MQVKKQAIIKDILNNNSDTLNKIHGGIDYEDKGGIDLSTGADEFFKDLTKLIKDKPLYKVSGKIPIKLEVKYIKDWHDPLDKMEIALFNTKKYRPLHGAFGKMRAGGAKSHTGLDLFALDGTPVYACMDGIIHYNYSNPDGFGYRIFLEIDTEKGLDKYKNRIREKNYQLLYPNLKEILMGNGYEEDSNVYTFAYCHLKEFDHKLIGTRKEVKAGDLIGYTGSTGNAKGSASPHLHIEIRCIGASGLVGLGQKINPACIFDFKYPSNEIAPCNKWSDHKSIDDFFFQIKIHIKNILKQIFQNNIVM